MQTNTFKALLDKFEVSEDPQAVGNYAYSLKQFDALTASAFALPYSKNTGIGNRWTKAHSAYADNDDIEDSIPVLPVLPVLVQPTGPTSLAQLKADLRQDLSIKELSRLRRRFAFENHPDRTPAAERISASRRLAIANDLVDLAIQNAHRKIAPQ